MLVLIDNYDSFTYNLVPYFGELGVAGAKSTAMTASRWMR